MEISILITTVVVAVIILLYFILSRQKKDISSKKKPRENIKNIHHRPVETAKDEPRSPSISPEKTRNYEDAGGMTLDELGKSGIHGTLRKFMQSGIETVFAPLEDSSDTAIMPLTKKDISPETMKVISNHIATLKNFRAEHIKLQQSISNPSVQMADLSKIIQSDPILAAKILRMANSSYFGMQNKIDSIGHALMILGLQNIKNILYRENMLQMFKASSPKTERENGLFMEACQSYFQSALHTFTIF